jgi:regulator of nucleoside diphosphate kinase
MKGGEIMEESTIYVTEFDLKRLSRLLNSAWLWNKKDMDYLTKLEEELERAQIVSPQDIPGDVVTMNSRARIKDLDSNEEMVFALVFPRR